MNSKASIQVSVNFLVVIIISIIVMGFGFMLLRQMIDGGDGQVSGMDDKLKEQIAQSLINSNDPVSVPIVQKEIERGKLDYFGVGVLNVDGTQDFSVVFETLEPTLAVRISDGSEITLSPSDPVPEIIPFNYVNVEILNNEHYVFDIPFRVDDDVKSGVEYVYTFNVKNGPSSPTNVYDGPFKLYVKVP